MTPAPTSRWLRPGRLIVLAAAVVIVLAAVATLARVSRPSAVPLASNGVGLGAVVTSFEKPGDELCVRTVAPKGAGAVQIWLGWAGDSGAVSLSGTVALPGGPTLTIASTPIRQAVGGGFVDLPLSGVVQREAHATVCFTRAGVGDGRPLDVAGASVFRRAGEIPAAMDGRSLAGQEPSIRFAAPGDPSISGLRRIGVVLDRLSAQSPSGFSPVLIGVVVFGVVPAALALLLWNLATAPRRSARRVAALCTLGSLALAFTWATVTPIFQGPDEPEHFAYAQRLAFTGHRADPSRASTRPPYSTQETAVLSLLHTNAVSFDKGARQPWTATTRRDVNATATLPRTDGGGYTESATGHSALYYAVISPAMHLGGRSLTGELYAARLETAILGCFIAGLAVWAAAIVVPGRRRVGALAGLAAATIPMAGATAGVLNNDTLVNLAAAGAFIAVLTVLRRPGGPLWPFAALGALILVLPIVKVAGIGLAVTFGGALVVAAVLRRRPLAILQGLAAGAGGFVGAAAVLAILSGLLVDGQTLTLFNNHPAVAAAAGGAPGLPIPFVNRIDYAIQLFLPFIHVNYDLYPPAVPIYRIYVMGTWGGYGWNRFYLPTSVNLVLGGLTVLGILAGWWAVFRERAGLLRDRKLLALAVALTPLFAMLFVAEAFVGPTPRPTPPEQGRYLLIALVPVALWFTAVPGIVGPGRLRSLLTGAIAGGLCAMSVVGLLAATVGWAA
ncbi:MAG: DUF2142 domain-containing protein [Solirubrobacteraceae bacterium]|nr:DUF2142 domain-containing protein [Patulibacter sp.]